MGCFIVRITARRDVNLLLQTFLKINLLGDKHTHNDNRVLIHFLYVQKNFLRLK